MSQKDLILLSASPDVGVGTVEGSGVQGEEDGRFRYIGGTTKE
jgi:hypothetical protein